MKPALNTPLLYSRATLLIAMLAIAGCSSVSNMLEPEKNRLQERIEAEWQKQT